MHFKWYIKTDSSIEKIDKLELFTLEIRTFNTNLI